MTTSIPDEYTKVERPLIEQLKSLGWQHIEGDIDVPYLTERDSFREVLVAGRLREAVRRINIDENGDEWLDDSRISHAVGALERLGAVKLVEANQAATELLLKGTQVEGDPDRHGGKEQTVRFIDFDHPERNDFLAINQFRINPAWAVADRDFIVPDIVLFVNGIPLVVIECKSPAATNPMEEGITQLLRYANLREWVEENEGVERLFHYNQFMVATKFDEARAGTISASYEHYTEWKDTSPVPASDVAKDLGVSKLSSQQTLTAGMLRPAHLLDVIRNFTVFKQDSGRTLKIVGRYQQFRAVHETIRRLTTGKTREQDGEFDRRGGIIWHTQGSGKSLTMVFLVRKMRTIPELRRFKVVVVTDRIDLEDQLRSTATYTGETVRPSRKDWKRKESPTRRLMRVLREDGADLVFGMIHKYRNQDKPDDHRDQDQEKLFPVLNESSSILLLVDEAHRSQAHDLHANLMKALPNCAKIGFTGTPIIMGERKRTHEIFGEFIDRYTIKQSEDDDVTVPILYEGREVKGAVANGGTLDELFAEAFKAKTQEEMEAIKKRFATKSRVLEAPELIAAKARDILQHYVDSVMPNGFKAQLVATSRLAAIRYQGALCEAHQELLKELERLNPALLRLSDEEREKLDERVQFLIRAHPRLETIRRLEFATIISGDHNDEPFYKEWSDAAKKKACIERFKRPLVHSDSNKQDGLAFLCVKSMLLTGFDAPLEQVLYLDRFMQGHELLQAIARVNRKTSGKKFGLVVDYFGVGGRLKEALRVYSAEDIEGALVSIKDELPRLRDRHQRVLNVFHDRGIPDIGDDEACVELLRDIKIRAEFIVKLKQFLESLDIIMPRPEGLPYVRDARQLGFINKAAANRYRDSQLNIVGAGPKVRELIDEYITLCGIDPKVPPISITDEDFEAVVDGRASTRAKASEMEHAARYHISKHFHEDPAYYRKLSERLEEILRGFENNWEELVKALREFTRTIRRGRAKDESGLDPKTQAPFLGILMEETDAEGKEYEEWKGLIPLTVELVDHIRQEIHIRDFWRNAHAQEVLRGWIVRFLDDNDIIPFERQEAVADRLVQLAKARHVSLMA